MQSMKINITWKKIYLFCNIGYIEINTTNPMNYSKLQDWIVLLTLIK